MVAMDRRMSTQQAVIHVVDDDEMFRTAICRLLKTANYQVVTHASAQELCQRPPGQERGCILLDMRMPGMDGLEAQSRLMDVGSSLPVVFLTAHVDIATSVRAIKAGAEDYLPKPVTKKQLLDAIGRALARYDEAHERNSRACAERELFASLTHREREVLSWVVRGKLNKQIAHELGTSERTIKAQRHNMMLKLGVRSLPEAVLLAERLGLIGAQREGALPTGLPRALRETLAGPAD
jgi:FixJ family two-component response regulator